MGTSTNAFHGISLHGKAKTRFSPFLHFQSLVVIEKGSTSQCRSGTSVLRGALIPTDYKAFDAIVKQQ